MWLNAATDGKIKHYPLAFTARLSVGATPRLAHLPGFAGNRAYVHQIGFRLRPILFRRLPGRAVVCRMFAASNGQLRQ